MNSTLLLAGLGVAILALPALFFLGRRAGISSEVRRLTAAKSTVEETSKRLLTEAEREAENLRKSAVVAGKEELIKLRETFEIEVRGRRVEVERDWVRAEKPAATAAAQFLRRLTRRLYDEKVFSVVLTPSFDSHHKNHFHLDGAPYTVDGT